MRFTPCGRVLALAAGMALTAGATPAVAAEGGPYAVKIELGRTVFPDLAPGLSLPISPDWVTITPQEAAGG